jgi:hypothetical protein
MTLAKSLGMNKQFLSYVLITWIVSEALVLFVIFTWSGLNNWQAGGIGLICSLFIQWVFNKIIKSQFK